MMKVLVTGAAGFIGFHVTKKLAAEGRRVVGIDSMRAELYSRSIKKSRARQLKEFDSVEVIEEDLLCINFEQVLSDVDVVVHLAALPGQSVSWTKFDAYVDCNLRATQRLAQATQSSAVSRVVHVSTSSVYGAAPNGDEAQACAPISPYGVTKFAAEGIWQAYNQGPAYSTACLRLFSVYGPEQRPDMGFHKMIKAGLRGDVFPVHGGHQARDFTYVADVADAVSAAIDASLDTFETFNIAGGETRPLSDSVRIIEEELGVRLLLKETASPLGNQITTTADCSKARRLLGYAPKISLEAGLQRQVEWMRGVVEL